MLLAYNLSFLEPFKGVLEVDLMDLPYLHPISPLQVFDSLFGVFEWLIKGELVV